MSKKRPKTITDENIDKAIAWYEANLEEITAVLPISTPGVLYKKGYSESLSKPVQAWKDGKTPLNLAICYIYRPIKAFYSYLEAQK